VQAELTSDDLQNATDEALLVAVGSQANRAAFKELFHRFAGRIKAFLIKGGARGDQAEEVAQDVMVTIWRKAGSFDPDKASAATWIFTISRNRRIDLIRRERRPEPDPEDPLYKPDAPEGPYRALAREVRDRLVREALASLSDEQREIVQLSFFSGLSHGEIAEQLGVPLGTVKSRTRLAFNKLRGVLGTEFSDELKES
jgi:RNA polymerase sigma-70 factor (ECF subfamily)